MQRRHFIVGAAAFAASPALAQAALPRVQVQTPLGAFVLELASDKAPVTAANFLRYVDTKRYDGAAFYRALRNDWDAKTGLLQGGLQNDPARLLPPIAHEPTTKTGLTHKDGTVSVARWAPGTATSDFFICLGEAAYLDADPKAPGDNLGFAAFGQVVEGLDVLHAIHDRPTDPVKGAGAMKGQMLMEPVKILAARRLPSDPQAPA